MARQTEVLLLEDVVKLGRKGSIVTVKPGYALNFLFPNKKAVKADSNAKRMQARLQEERLKQAATNKAESEAIKARVDGITVEYIAKVDPIGHMYAAIKNTDIIDLLAEKGVTVDKHQVLIPKTIKQIGNYEINLELKEDVTASFELKVIAEGSEEVTESNE